MFYVFGYIFFFFIFWGKRKCDRMDGMIISEVAEAQEDFCEVWWAKKKALFFSIEACIIKPRKSLKCFIYKTFNSLSNKKFVQLLSWRTHKNQQQFYNFGPDDFRGREAGHCFHWLFCFFFSLLLPLIDFHPLRGYSGRLNFVCPHILA